MKSRREFLTTVGTGSAALAATAAMTGTASAQGTASLRISHFTPETSLMYQVSMTPFAQRLAEIADGRINVQLFSGGIIVPPLEIYQAAEDGLVDAVIAPPIWVVNRDPANSFFGGHPGGMPAEMFMHWLYYGGGTQLLAEHRRETMGMHALPVSISPSEIWHSHKEIRVSEDLKGVRFRTAGTWATILNEYFGAAATTVPPSEVYTMLERNGVDVAEWSTPSENVIVGLENAAPYVIIPGAHAPSLMQELVIPVGVWDALDDDLKTKIELAARLTAIDSLMDWTMKDLSAMEKIEASNAKIINVDQSLIDDIREAGRKWSDKVAGEREATGDTWMRRVMDSYYGFYDYWLAHGRYRPLD